MPNLLTEDMELHPELRERSTTDLHRAYFAKFRGFDLVKAFKKAAQNQDAAKKTAAPIDKALKAALADLNVLVSAIEGVDALPKTHKPAGKALTKAETKALEDEPYTNADRLIALFHRIRDGWATAAEDQRAAALDALKVASVKSRDAAPAWDELLAMFSELHALDVEGDGGALPASLYEALVTRHEATTKAKKAKKGKRAAPRPVLTPPSDDKILKYSPRETFRFGQWIRHPKFGVGCIVEAGDHLIVEFEDEQKRLVHVPVPMEKLGVEVADTRKSQVDTAELARQSNITITKLPPQVLED